jgi:hypothetical protein
VGDEGSSEDLGVTAPCDELTPPPHVATPETHEETRNLWLSWRMVPLYILGAVSVGVIAVDVMVIRDTLTGRTEKPELKAAVSVVPAVASATPPQEPPSRVVEDGDEIPSPEPPVKPRGDAPKAPRPRKAQSVEQALASGCSTGSVDGLSRQLVTEARCVDSRMFSPVPRRKNLVTAGNVFLYLEAPARDQLLKVLDANPGRTLTVNSAFRTIAQQFLLDRWARSGRCGIKLAAHPGESNHETGLALDVREPGVWRTALEAHGFRWMGASDPVHFDYQGPGAVRREGVDILAFQRLWNRNHPEDRIPENGAYSDQLEARIKKSPAAGFPKGPLCGNAPQVSVKPASKTP